MIKKRFSKPHSGKLQKFKPRKPSCQSSTHLYKVMNRDFRTELAIYDIISHQEKAKILNIKFLLDCRTSIRFLPSGSHCSFAMTAYFNGSIYCFGGWIYGGISKRFDLTNNRWINLACFPAAAVDGNCHGVVFDEKFILSLYEKNLFLYSIEVDSFSLIPFDFSCGQKLLISLNRLYLIEWSANGLIYESEDEYNWKIMAETGQSYTCHQFYVLHYQEKVYISTGDKYYEFNLQAKSLFEIKTK